jgi:hypothetical protein
MNELVWRYQLESTYTEVYAQEIGCTDDVLASAIDAHDDDTSVYVSADGFDNDSNYDGTQALPYRTVIHALNELQTGQSIITILDSEEYYTGESGTLTLNLDGIVLQGINGQTPTLTIDPTVASQEYMIDLKNSGKVINCKIVVPDDYASQVTCVRAYAGTIKNCTIDGATRDGVVMPATATALTVQNSIIKNSNNEGTTDGNGIRLDQGTLTISRSLIADNDRAGIYATGSAAKGLDADYITIAGNQYGLLGHGATNLTLNIKDSIDYENTIYDYYNTAGTIEYSCVGSVNGSPNTVGNYIRFNPFFIGNSDYRIRTLHNGYGDAFVTSPAIGVSSTGIDVGCYQMTRTTGATVYNEFITERPDTYIINPTPIEPKTFYSNTLRPKILKKGDVNILSIAWENMESEQFENLKILYDNEYEVYLSVDNGVSYQHYIIDVSKGFAKDIPVFVIDQTMRRGVSLTLIEV